MEIRDSEPRPFGRWIARSIMLLLALAVAWAVLGRVDVVAVASGRVIPDGRSKIVQPFEAGIVRGVYVRDGQAVKQGDLLLSFEAAEVRAEQTRVRGELDAERAALVSALGLRKLLTVKAPTRVDFERAFAAAADEAGIADTAAYGQLQTDLLISQWQEYRRNREVLQRRDGVRRAERRSLQSEVLKLEHRLPILKEQSAAVAALYARQSVARKQWLERDLEYLDAQQELTAAHARLDGVAEEMAQIQAELAARTAGEGVATLAAIETHRRNVAAIGQDLARIEERAARLELRAPIDGTVQQMAVRAAGAVVKPAEPLLVIVPHSGQLEVEAWVLNRDIGFVHAGQTAAVKVEAFNFTRYGLLDARVATVSAEAIEHPQLGLVYAARVLLAQQSLQVEERRATIAPGMAVQVEIRTGTRRIIDYFLSPLRKVAQESIRER